MSHIGYLRSDPVARLKLEEVLQHVSDHQLRPRYAETDQMGVVYYANYLVWFECARVEWLRSLGISYADMERQGVCLPVRRCEITYHGSARYDRLITIRARPIKLTPARIQFSYEVIDDESGDLLAEGMTLHAFADLTGKVTRLGFEAIGIDE